MNTKVRYVIEKEYDSYVLYSIVPTNFGGDAKNFVCQGTKDFCELQKNRLESRHES